MTGTDGSMPTTRRIRPLMRRVSADHVQPARTLPSLPVQGAASGWLVRRDQALEAFTTAGVAGPALATLTVGDLRFGAGEVLVLLPGAPGGVVVPRCPDGRTICGACAVHRWVHALELTVRHSDPWVIPSILARAPALTPTIGHACLPARVTDPAIAPMALMPVIDQWGPVPTRPAPPPAVLGGALPRQMNHRDRPGHSFPGP